MSRAYLSDVVLDGSGKPVAGALVTLLRVSDYSTPPLVDPGPSFANYIAQTTSGDGGAFSFDHIPYDDYHLMVQYQGKTVFKYNVPALPVEVTDTKSTQARVLVPRTLSKLLRGDDVVIHFIGDSITVGYNSGSTVGAGFVQRMGVLIGQQIVPDARVDRYDPDSYGSLDDAAITGWNGPTTIQSPSHGSNQTVQIVNNGVSGDTVQRVLRRFGNLTGWTPKIDLLVVYLGINDSLTNASSKFVTPDDFKSAMRSLVEILRNYYPQAEVVLCTQHANDQPDAGFEGVADPGQYTLEMYAHATRQAALETGTALVDLRQSWADARDPNNLGNSSDGYPSSWLNNNGGNHTHPSDQGHQAIAEEMIKIFAQPGLAAGRPPRIQTLGPQKHFKDYEVVRLPTSNPALQFTGSWASYTPGHLSGLYFSANLIRSKTLGDYLSFTDRMSDFSLLVRRGRDCGQFSVAIDGGTPVQFESYRAHPTNILDTDEDGSVYPMDKIVIAQSLGDTYHTVVVRPLGTKDPASSDAWVYIDGIEYTRLGYTAQKLECPQELSKVQYGSFTVTFDGTQRYQTVAITFPLHFRSGLVPSVVANMNQIDFYCSVDSTDYTGCNIRAVHRDGTNATGVFTGQYIAIG